MDFPRCGDDELLPAEITMVFLHSGRDPDYVYGITMTSWANDDKTNDNGKENNDANFI